jgi:DNA invertase Pin-like site-specific DNA recombinase
MRKKRQKQKRDKNGKFVATLDEAKIRDMHNDYRDGIGYTELARKYGYSRSTICEAFQRYSLPTSRKALQ